jgi:hypothetical protein
MNPNDIFFVIFRWLLASPILLARFIIRTVRWMDFWATAYRHEILCRNCGASISLVGIWRCKCNYTYKGHILEACKVCGALPRMARCFRCGLTEKLPEL